MHLRQYLLLLAFLFSFHGLQAQSLDDLQALVLKEYVPAFCKCMDKNKPEDPLLVISVTSTKCHFEYALKNASRLMKLIEDKYSNLSKEEQFIAGRMIGGDIKIIAADQIVKTCTTFRNALKELKIKDKASLSRREIKKEVKKLDQKLKAGATKKNYLDFVTLGIFYERLGKDKQALIAYQKSNELKKSMFASALITLLTLERQ